MADISITPEAHGLLATLMEEMTAGIAQFDPAGCLLLINRRFAIMLGLEETTLNRDTTLASLGAALPAEMATPATRRVTDEWSTPGGRRLHGTIIPSQGTLLLLRDVTVQYDADAQLAELRSRMETLLRNSEDSTVLMEADGTIIENSSRSGRLLSLPDDMVVPGVTHQDILRFMHRRGDFGFDLPEDEFVQTRRQQILQARNLVYPSRMPNGSWVEYRFRVQPDERLVVQVRDITALKQREAELEAERATTAEQRAMLHTIIENLPDGVMLYDQEFRWRIANRQVMEFQRLPLEIAHPGASAFDILRFQAKRGDFGSPPTDEAALESLVQERAAVMRKPGGSQYIRQTAGGQWIEFNMIPLPDGGLLSSYRDISLLKQAQETVEQERTLLREILDACDALIVVSDQDSNVLLANNRQRDIMETPDHLYRPGTNLGDAIRHRYRAGVYGFDRDEETTVAERLSNPFRGGAGQGGTAQGGALHYTRTMPSGRSVEHLFTPISGGRLVGFHRDITALKQREAELERERAAAAEQRAVLHSIIENLPDAVTLFDQDFRWRIANPKIMQIQRFSPEIAYPGASGFDILRFQALRGDFGPPPTDELALEAFVQEHAAMIRRPGGSQYTRRTAGGQWVEINSTQLPDGGMLMFFRDITQVKQAEADLQLVLDNLRDGVALAEGNGDWILANRAMHDMNGLPQALFTEHRNIREGYHRHILETGEVALEDGQSMEQGLDAFFERFRHPTGQPFLRRRPNGRLIEHTVMRVPGDRRLLVQRDVTALHAAQEETEKERGLLREVLDAADALVVLLDRDANVLLANTARRGLMGTSDDDYQPGTNLADAIRSRYRLGIYGHDLDEETTVRSRVANAFSGGVRRYERLMPSGTWVESVWIPISDGRLLGFQRDITRLKVSELAALAARDAAEAAAQAKSAFLAAMSHEIRTPMNGVLGMLEVLGRSHLNPEQARGITVMRESAQSLLRIIDDVLDFSKIEAGRLDVEALPFSLRGLIEGSIETLTPEARRRGLALFVDAPGPGPDWLMGDPTRVRQILFNLIGNALKFTERGFVRIAADARAENGGTILSLTVEDSGVGMDQPTRDKLFQPFTQADSSTTRRYGGTGLGLSIVRRLAELMGGGVELESTLGRGSRFTVTLRLGLAEMPTATGLFVPMIDASAELQPTMGRILIVDDHPVNREVMTRQLEILGMEADTAVDGAAGLAAWRAGRPRIVLLDIHMPVMDGFDLARAIRADEEREALPRTTLIAVTANALKGEAERCYAAGMDGFLAKPFTIDGLSRVLARFTPGVAGQDAPGSGALFDPDALRALFGQDSARLRGILNSFAESAAHDIAGLAKAPAFGEAAAHRLKGAARMVGARLLAEAAQRLEQAAQAGDRQAAEALAQDIPRLLADTLAVAHASIEAQSAGGTKI